MPLNDCDPVTTLENIDPTLATGTVTFAPGSIASGSQIVPALTASWASITNPYVTGVQFDYVATDAADAKFTTVPVPKALLQWSATEGVSPGRAYYARSRAVGSNDTYGLWSSTTTITAPTTNLAGGVVGGGVINVGGTQNIPASAQPILLSLADGDVVTFSPTYGVAPQVTFTTAGLAPLAAGETYYVAADGLTGSGFTARLKKRTPGTPTYSTRTDGPVTSQTAPDDWQMDKGIANDTSNNVYTFRVKGTVFVNADSYDIFGSPITLYNGTMTLTAWIRPGGVGGWISIGSIYVYKNAGPGGVTAWDVTTNFSVSTAMGSGAGTEYRVTVSGRNDATNDVITEFTSVAFQWQSGGGAPTDATATPNGERVAVTVTPTNQ